MKNLKVGTRVYHWLNMAKIGTITSFKKDPKNNMWLTEGTPSTTLLAIVEFDDGSTAQYPPGDLFKEDNG